MTEEPDRDGILDPRASEPVAKPPEIEAVDRWAAEPDNLAAWEAARRWLAHAAGDVDEALDAARTALLLAPDGPERERARRELLDLLADRRPLAASAHFRPAANITDPLPRPVLRAAGMSGAVLAEGAVCLLSGAGGAAKSTLATTLALDVAYGGELADPDGADGMGKGFSGLFDVRPGPVMMASYEDPAGVSGWRLRELARARWATDAALERIHVAHTAGLPLYGPTDNGLYNARPEPMRGWAHLWAAADIIRPALVVIDPALDAYTGDPNNLAGRAGVCVRPGRGGRGAVLWHPAGGTQPQGRQGQGLRPLRPRTGGRRGSVGRRRQGSPDADRPGRQPHTGNRQGQLGPRLRPGAARAGVQRCRGPDRIRHGRLV